MATKEFFPGIGKIQFEGKESKNPMAFRYYDANKVVLGKTMAEWLKFAMAWWHTLCAEGADQFGGGTKSFPWNAASDAVEVAKAGSINKAAELLFVAQPNLSRAIKELEADLGITIFDRSAKGMVLTIEGRGFVNVQVDKNIVKTVI